MSMYDAFKTDPKKEAEGVLVEFGEFRVTVRRAGGANKLYQKTMEALVAPYRRILQLGQMQEATMKAILAEGYAKAVVTNWEYRAEVLAEDGLGEPSFEWRAGIELPGGEMGEVSPENVKAVLIAFPEIFEAIKETAEAIRSFKSEADEAAKGN